MDRCHPDSNAVDHSTREPNNIHGSGWVYALDELARAYDYFDANGVQIKGVTALNLLNGNATVYDGSEVVFTSFPSPLTIKRQGSP